MCGIVAYVGSRRAYPILIKGLQRLEYRGYDSAGIGLITDDNNSIITYKQAGKVSDLLEFIGDNDTDGSIGIGHTRWATHGPPNQINSHPHSSSDSSLSLIHNGIIENYSSLKKALEDKGYEFKSDTDSEVLMFLIEDVYKNICSNNASNSDEENRLYRAIRIALNEVIGAYAIVVIDKNNSEEFYAARKGSPLVIGIGNNCNYIASDQMALLSVTKKFIFLEEGDVAEIKIDAITIFDKNGYQVDRPIKTSNLKEGQVDKGLYSHFMQKEIFEQPQAIRDTLESRITKNKVVKSAFGADAKKIFNQINQVQIVACGTSFNAAIVAKYWLEDIAKMPCNVEVASEYRYRRPILLNGTLFLTLSQSGETADTLEALKAAKKINKSINIFIYFFSSL